MPEIRRILEITNQPYPNSRMNIGGLTYQSSSSITEISVSDKKIKSNKHWLVQFILKWTLIQTIINWIQMLFRSNPYTLEDFRKNKFACNAFIDGSCFEFSKNDYLYIINEFLDRIDQDQDPDRLIEVIPNQRNKFNYFIYNNRLVMWILSEPEFNWPNRSIESNHIFYTDIEFKKMTDHYEIKRCLMLCGVDYMNEDMNGNCINENVFEFMNNESRRDIMT